MTDYEFTQDWFSSNIPTWQFLLAKVKPRRILEIGSYEGRSACFLIEQVASERPIELHCVDKWGGKAEVEQRFDRNIEIAISAAPQSVTFRKHKNSSSLALVQLLAEGYRETFDFIYVDGSHAAPDVLADAVLGFELASIGAAIVFDDYLWQRDPTGVPDHYSMPKPAIDAFVNIYRRKLEIVAGAPLYQLYLQKISG
jgi:predicted O-methyltransferase YrrM